MKPNFDLKCTECENIIKEKSINFTSGSLYCPKCNSFLILNKIPEFLEKRITFRKKYLKPKKIKKTIRNGKPVYTYRWGNIFNLFGFLFSALILFGFIYSLYESRDNIFALLFGSIFLTIIFIVNYAQLCWFINKTEFQLDKLSLKIKTNPLPWPKTDKIISLKNIKNLYCKKYHAGRYGMVISMEMINGDGEIEIVFGRWNNYYDPIYFEYEIKTFLKMADESVNGEFIKHPPFLPFKLSR
jgi:hypothetical protein